jgi:hypothetical protein
MISIMKTTPANMEGFQIKFFFFRNNHHRL